MNIKEGIVFLKNSDPIVNNLISKHGACDLKPSNTYFQNLVKSIISQQLSNKAASTIYKRFEAKVSNLVTPQKVLRLNNQHFREAGISKQKMGYLLELCNIYIKDIDFFKNIITYKNAEIIEELTKIKGIGTWTAQMFLIFSLNRLDVLPLDDIGLRNSVKLHYKLRKNPDKKKLILISKKWGNYSSIAVWYLWKALDNKN